MEKEEYIRRVSEQLKGFTAIKSSINPYKWDYSDNGVFKNERRSVNIPPQNPNYSFVSDKRLATVRHSLRQSKAVQMSARLIAAGITAAFMDNVFHAPDEEDLDILLDSASLDREDICFITGMLDDDTMYEQMMFQRQMMNEYAILFYLLLWCAACDVTGANATPLDSLYREKKESIKKGSYVARFRKFLHTSIERDLVDLQTDIQEALSTENSDVPISLEVADAFDKFAIEMSIFDRKIDILNFEMRAESKRIEAEARKIREIGKKEAISSGRKASKKLSGIIPEMSQAQKTSFNFNVSTSMCNQRLFDKISDNMGALADYQEDIWKEAYAIQNSANMEITEYFNSLTANEIEQMAEGAMLEILNHSECFTDVFERLSIGRGLICITDFPMPGTVTMQKDSDDDCDSTDEMEMVCDTKYALYIDQEATNDVPFDEKIPFTEFASIKGTLSEYAGYYCVKPVEISKKLVAKLEKLGIETECARIAAGFAEGLKYAKSNVSGIPSVYSSKSFALQGKTDNDNVKTDQEKSLEQENARLRTTVKRIEKEKQSLSHTITALQKEAESYQAQIAELEARLKDEDQSDNPAAVEESVTANEDSPFPYTTDKNIVLIGGHPNFCANLKKLIPNIRVVPESAHYDEKIFKNADIVFIQINCISHSNYYTAVDAAKRGNTEVFHLNYGGAERCALDIIHETEKLKAKGE